MDKETKSQPENDLESQKEDRGELTSAEKASLLKEDEKPEELVTDNMLMGVYGEILEQNKKDRAEIDDILANFVDMVINEGDASNSSKETLVGLLKLKNDVTGTDIKIADLMTRIKLKEKNTMQDWQKAKSNTINIIDQSGQSKRSLIEALEKSKGKKK